MLKLCDIAIPAGTDYENIRVLNADNYVLSALEIRQFLKRFENLEYNMALEDLDKEVLQNEQVTNKRGIFTALLDHLTDRLVQRVETAQASLTAEGYPFRVYVPFGQEWFPYFMRRLGERPANVMFVAKSLMK